MDNMNIVNKEHLYEIYKDEQCPVCGYYCLGKGGLGCIDKPSLCGLDKLELEIKYDSKINRSK